MMRAWRVEGTWWIVGLLTFCFTINFIDRLVLSTVAPTLLAQLHLTNTDYSYIVFAFMLGMTLGQIPVGALIDRLGVRWSLAGIFAGWSFSNMAQALARNAWDFRGLRFLMGLCECGNYSAGVKSIAEIFPAEKRSLPLGVFNSGTLLGSLIAPPLIVYVSGRFGWRQAFFLPSLAGLVWIPLWLQARRPRPRPAETSEPSPQTWEVGLRDLLALRQTWGVTAMRALSGPLVQFYWYWLPLYLVRSRGLSMKMMAGLASLSYLAGGLGQIGGGYFSGWLIQRGWTVDRARKVTYALSAGITGAGTAFTPFIHSPFHATVAIGLANFGINVMSNQVMAVTADVFPGSTLASVAGLTGVGEGLVSMAMMLFTGVIVDRFSWVPVFTTVAFIPFGSLAALLLLVHRCHPITLQEFRDMKCSGSTWLPREAKGDARRKPGTGGVAR
jgi:ACS family hexuronate transporter-like MFS transporter